MRCNYIREKKFLCGNTYMAVGVFSITPAEHRARRKKSKESTEGQKAKNKMASLRRRQRVALANFSKYGFFLTGTYEDFYLPEELEACRRDVRNYLRRVIECKGLNDRERREWREMLEDLWRRRIPGTNEFDPLGTINVDRMDMKKLLGKDGSNGTLGYLYGHKERLWVETQTLRRPVEQAPNDTRWSRKQLRAACGEMANDPYWWSQRFPGWELEKCVVLEPGELHPAQDPDRPDGWERVEPQCYVILRRQSLAILRT